MEPVFPGNIAGAIIRAVSRNGSKIPHLCDIAGLQHRLFCAIVSRKKRQFFIRIFLQLSGSSLSIREQHFHFLSHKLFRIKNRDRQHLYLAVPINPHFRIIRIRIHLLQRHTDRFLHHLTRFFGAGVGNHVDIARFESKVNLIL